MDDLMPPMGEELNPVVYIFLVCRAVLLPMPWVASPVGSGMGKGRSGSDRRAYPFEGGESFPDYGWFRKNSGGLMHIAAEKTPNSYGVYDTLGNAWEWVFDRFGFYQLRNKDNPQGPKPAPIGCFVAVLGTILRTIWTCPASRQPPRNTRFNVGFRCAADLPE